MTTTETQDIVEILNRIEGWPRPKRVFLAQRILEVSDKDNSTTRGVSADQAMGLLKTAGVPPSDAECQKMLEDELLEKYHR